MYIKRTDEDLIKDVSKKFAVLILTGPRQVGKSTTLLHLKPDNMKYVTLDDFSARKLAVEDPKYFLETYGTPLLIDEIQYAPNLLSFIKIKVDEYKFNNLKNNKDNEAIYWLTGSQQFKVMKNISESLAGRAAIININSLSFNEINRLDDSLFSPVISDIQKKKMTKIYNSKDIFHRIFMGGMPSIVVDESIRDMYFSSYINTYIERDVKEIVNVGKSLDFFNFLQYIAARTAQEINYSTISKEIGVDAKTIKSWISILEASGIIFLLEPYSTNKSNRLIKSKKLYFMDTGFCTYLAKYPNEETLENGALSGAIFETFVVTEIIKNLINHGVDPTINLFYYRDNNQKEIDLLYVQADSIYPIEIKKGVYPNHPDKNFNALNKYNLNIKPGLVICLTDKLMPINKDCWLCPVSLI